MQPQGSKAGIPPDLFLLFPWRIPWNPVSCFLFPVDLGDQARTLSGLPVTMQLHLNDSSSFLQQARLSCRVSNRMSDGNLVAAYGWWPLMVGRAGGGQQMSHFYGKHY